MVDNENGIDPVFLPERVNKVLKLEELDKFAGKYVQKKHEKYEKSVYVFLRLNRLATKFNKCSPSKGGIKVLGNICRTLH